MPVDLSAHWVKLLVSLCLGSLIGLEREFSDKAAGLRTNILICVGATLYTILSSWFEHDPARISAQIVSGIGFLGAGAIMREGDRVTGLTTAAMIWVVAAIGTAVGYGHYTVATMVVSIVLVVQLAFTQIDILIDEFRERHIYRVICAADDRTFSEIALLFKMSKVRVMRHKVMRKNGFFHSEWATTGTRVDNERLIKKLLESKDVVEVTY
jgi:putative Mg2+ transporter-C (MgtC) family protein